MAKKKKRSKDFKPERDMKRMASSMAEMMAGVAEAMGKGFRTLKDEVTDDNVTEFGPSNGLFKGSTKGVLQAREDGTQAARDAWDDYVEDDEDENEAEEQDNTRELLSQLDYERLAKLVAKELAAAKAADQGGADPS